MRKGIRRNIVEASQLDEYIKIIKNVSVVSSLVTGLGLVMLYFLGIAIFSSMVSAFGIYPFEFTLRKCLEYGSVFFIEILAIFPLLLWIGLKEFLFEAGALLHLLFSIPLVLIFAIKFIGLRSRLFASKLLSWVVLFTLLYMLILLVVVYYGVFSTMGAQSLLLDPAVNVVIQHKAELEKGVSLSKFGVNNMDTATLNMIIKDENWKTAKIGILLVIVLVSVLYTSIVIAVSGKTISNTDLIPQRVHGYLVLLRRSLICTFVIFLGGFLFVVSGRTFVLMASTEAQKVDVSFRDRKDITSQYYAILVAEYDNDYMFYFPNLQNLIRVSKNKVENILFKGKISIFADRYYFRKGSWLGISGEWAFTKDKQSEDKKIIGFKVNIAHVNSPAYKANLLPEDIITSIDRITIDGSRQISEIVGGIPPGKNIQLVVRRSNTIKKLSITIENKP